MRLAIVTCEPKENQGYEDDKLVQSLEMLGASAERVAWTEDVDWSRFATAVIRTTWDYHLRFEQFQDWLTRAESMTRVLNEPGLIRWNWNKGYLIDLADKGVPIVPTLLWSVGQKAFRSAGDISLIGRVMPGLCGKGSASCNEGGDLDRTERVVIKPTIGSTAFGSGHFGREQVDQANAHLSRLLKKGDALIQPFMGSIQTEGELSLVYFDGAYSHAVLKTPPEGEYRSQSEFGGTYKAVEPNTNAVEVAELALKALDTTPVFARVDMVLDEGFYKLMELELIEPELFIPLRAEASDRLARAIVSRL